MGTGAEQRLISVPRWMYCHLKQVRRRARYRFTHLGRRRRVEGSGGCISTAMGSQIASGILSVSPCISYPSPIDAPARNRLKMGLHTLSEGEARRLLGTNVCRDIKIKI